MKALALSIILPAGFLSAAYAAPNDAAPSASKEPPPLACTVDNTIDACLNRHGEDAAKALSKAYGDVAGKLDAACSEVISPGMTACLGRAQEIADKKLNATYARAMKAISSEDNGKKWQEELRLAQQTWMRFRDADCGDLITDEWHGGTGTYPAIATCLLGHTEARTAELKRRYDRW
ncbi:DUF1311 domain-containing protein [Methylobacterium organophilum]|nr:DUF1311 domain-containing protein [Methylobacterium organophilum]